MIIIRKHTQNAGKGDDFEVADHFRLEPFVELVDVQTFRITKPWKNLDVRIFLDFGRVF